MKSLKLSIKNSTYFLNLFSQLNTKKLKNESFLRWLLISYFGASTLLLLSLHSYCMGTVF